MKLTLTGGINFQVGFIPQMLEITLKENNSFEGTLHSALGEGIFKVKGMILKEKERIIIKFVVFSNSEKRRNTFYHLLEKEKIEPFKHPIYEGKAKYMEEKISFENFNDELLKREVYIPCIGSMDTLFSEIREENIKKIIF